MTTSTKCALSIAYGVTFALSVKDAAMVLEILANAQRVEENYGDTGEASHHDAKDRSRDRMNMTPIVGPILTVEEWRIVREARDAKYAAEQAERDAAKADNA